MEDLNSNFQRRKLKNGITVLFESRDLPLVSFGIANPFGGAYETEDVKGISHFIEHLAFTGTETRSSEQISGEIEKKGGILNAFTAQEVTTFWFKLPSEHLDSGMNILIDMLKNTTFNEEKFEKEKKVVIEEIKMYHDTPQREVLEKIEENLYESPFNKRIHGSEKTISSLKRDFVKSYFKEKYLPENYIVIVVGKADIDSVCEKLEKEFPATSKKRKLNHIKIRNKNEETIEERKNIKQAHFTIGMHAPMPTKRERYALEILDAYLAGGMSSKLFIEIREKRGLAYNVRGNLEYEKNYSHYVIYVGTTKEAVPEVKKLILEGFKEASEKMTEKDLKEAKEMLIGLKKVSSEEGINALNGLIFSEISTGNAEEYYQYEDKINSITLKEVKELAKKLPKKYSTAIIIPK